MTVRLVSMSTLGTLLLGCHSAPHVYRSAEITARELQQHVKFLSSDEMEGRAAGTQGNDAAARYIADEFSRYGLVPTGENGSFYQSFPVLSGVKAGKKNRMKISASGTSKNLVLDEDFRPLFLSGDTAVSGGVVFVGYGISSDSLHFDDYANVDVRGKIVFVLRYTPDYGKPDSRFYDHASLYRKVRVAQEKGASGIVLVTGPADEERPSLLPLRPERGLSSPGIAAVNVTSTIGDSILRWSGVQKNLRDLQQKIYSSKSPNSFPLPSVTLALETEVVKVFSNTSNVVGFLKGTDPRLKNEVVVVGAHFDHVGRGGSGSGSLSPETLAVHNGADDNASGTAALLEIAQALSAHRGDLNRSHLFIAFTAEEIGLVGSAHFVKSPSIPLDRIAAMINLDMIGRIRDSALTVEGVGTSPAWKTMLEEQNKPFNFRLKLGQGGFGPSDHASFYGKNIPVLFFFTGLHEDYHRPTDDWGKLNYEGVRNIAHYVVALTGALDKGDRPVFIRVQAAAGDSARRGFRVTLGIIPDYSESGAGLRISGTRAAGPADKAGLKGGDIIVKFNGKEVKNIYDFTSMLGNQKPGDEVEVVFMREGETKAVMVKLEARP